MIGILGTRRGRLVLVEEDFAKNMHYEPSLPCKIWRIQTGRERRASTYQRIKWE
jgi:hypothetical protein